MAKEITGQGKYDSKKTGKSVDFDFSYAVFDTLQDAIDTLGEDKVLKDVQRMVKLDASNTARESAKVANGDSTRKVMSEEEKAQNKAVNKLKTSAFDKIKANAKQLGVSVEDYLASLS